SVVLTDHPDPPRTLNALRQGLALNGFHDGDDRVSVMPLKWGSLLDAAPARRFRLLIASDTFFAPRDFPGLLLTISHVLAHHSHPDAVCLSAYQERSSKRDISLLLELYGL
ncbi:hypothetical protein DFJ74DRAFT_597752, partial [Hyaloraphidium curvatum]